MILNLKNIRNLGLVVLLLGFYSFVNAQELARVNFRISPQKATINSIVFTISELNLQFDLQTNNLYLLSRESKRNMEWSDYSDDEYYDSFSDGDKKGKIKSIGGVKVDYYDVFDGEKKGKIKSFGNVKIDYYDVFDGPKRGKIKSIGSHVIGYYDIFDGGEKNGKMRSFGNIKIGYYDVFSGGEKKGKLSSVGIVKIDYHDNSAPAPRPGKIKSIKGNTPDLYVTLDRRSRMSDSED
ncbi:hypothetical protein TH53_05765 [Pedobacter lusitanus]|uniref:Contig24, whole genome shotgun sequence n=1 Tax=Pedobacter lusitanus TaxID=1503925 RepID=A0A0D0F8N9_9SPHI|nr:hypothetical protein [Pedobacter lusitanus]KIO78098.1 hypothetical protein TH53_05765 [Pedobacter lusitanus]